MRLTGTLKSWDDERGFGFIAPTHGGAELFVHISALPRDGSRPTDGEKLSYELGRGSNGKPQAIKVMRLAVGDGAGSRIRAIPREPRQGGPALGLVFRIVLLLALAAYGFTQYQSRMVQGPQGQDPPEQQAAIPASPAPTDFHCDGRTHCSQMTSCAEAKLFLNNCPGVKMDGNHDDVPCEQQWCTSPFAR